MTWQEFLLLLASVFASVGGQFFLKAGALKLGQVSESNWISHILNIATTPELVAGLACYGLGAVTYILLLTRVNLSVAAPAVSLIYVFAVLIGFVVFREPIPFSRLVGLACIVCGVLLVIWKR